MYAYIKTGGKQYKVQKGDTIDVELLKVEEGKPVEFSDVLCLCDGDKTVVGTPNIEGCVVLGELVGTTAGPKEVSVKYTPRKRSYRKFGHRQKYSRVKITEIKGS